MTAQLITDLRERRTERNAARAAARAREWLAKYQPVKHEHACGVASPPDAPKERSPVARPAGVTLRLVR